MVEEETFYNCRNLTQVIMLEGEIGLTIGNRAFKGSELRSITIPLNVINIEDDAFRECYSLEHVSYNGIDYTSKTELINALEANGVTVSSFAFGD